MSSPVLVQSHVNGWHPAPSMDYQHHIKRMGMYPCGTLSRSDSDSMQTDCVSVDAENGIATDKTFQIQGRFFTAIALKLSGSPDERFYKALDAHLVQAPQFFSQAPVILDLDQTSERFDNARLSELVANLRQRRLSVFGVQNGAPGQMADAERIGLVAMSGGKDVPLKAQTDENDAKSRDGGMTAKPDEPPGTRIIDGPVRSGQTIFADRGDLIVTGPVSSGAELIAAGSIHVYGRMRGRAMAGVNGDRKARIFCQDLDAELLAIAGLYCTSDGLDVNARNQTVQVYLEGERLRFKPLSQ